MDDLRENRPQKPLVPKHDDRFVVKKPAHRKKSSRGVKYHLPIFANLDRVLTAKPSHSSLKQSEVQKAELVEAMYRQKAGRETIPEYLSETNSPYELVEQISDNVLVVRHKTTNENKVVVKGIDKSSFEDHVDLQQKLWFGEPTQSYDEALSAATEYGATEIIGHSRGASTAISVGTELGIPSVGFNGIISTENVRQAHAAPDTFRHTEFSNGEDIIVNGINEITNPHAHGKYPDNIEFKTFGGIEGEDFIGQHKASQWTSERLKRKTQIELPMEELAFKSRHAGDLITAHMFSDGVREGKTYRQILNENESGFGVVDQNGRFTSRNFRGNNLSKLFESVGGEHTPDEIAEMELHGTQTPHEHTLSDAEIQGIREGQGASMIDHALDGLADTYQRLPEMPTTKLRTFGKGVYRGVIDSFKPSALAEGAVAGLAGQYVANTLDRTVGRLPGELGRLQDSAVSFGAAGAFIGGLESGGVGLAAGLVSEGTRYGTDELLKKLGASDEVRGNLDAITSGAAAGAVLGGAAGGPIGAAVGAAVGGVVSETAHVVDEYGSRIAHFFENIF